MDWFVGTLLQIVLWILGAVLFFAALAAISGVGFFLRSGYQHVSAGRWGGGCLRWAYSGIVGSIVILLLLFANVDWIVWAVVLGLMLLGFVGVFIVPGDG